MDQTSLFAPTADELYSSYLCPALKKVICDNWLDEKSLVLNKQKQYYSVTFGGQVIARFADGKRPFISFPAAGFSYTEQLKKAKNGEKPGSDGYYRYDLASLAELPNYTEIACLVLDHIIEATPKDFSCCSRYVECSDQMKCVNPDYKLRIGCRYRNNLRSGKVFYGKNAQQQ